MHRVNTNPINPATISVQKPFEQLSHEEKEKFKRKIQLAALAWVGGKVIVPPVAHTLAKYQICLNALVPEQALPLINAHAYFSNKLAMSPINPLFKFLPFALALKTALVAQTIIVPIMKGIEFRFLFQELLLRRIPAAILNKYAPTYAHLAEAKVTRVMRVALSTLAFAIMHTARAADHTDPCLGPNYAVLGLGALLGTIAEFKGLGRSILAHMAITYYIAADDTSL